MSYQSDSGFDSFLRRYFTATAHERLVGPERTYDSGYSDIVRFFGDKSLNPDAIMLSYHEGVFQIADKRIAQYADEVARRLREEGRMYDGPQVMKLVGFRPEDKPPVMTVQAAEYADVAGSCFGLDEPHPLFEEFGGTLREYYKRQHPSNKTADNPLAISLGVSALLVCRSSPDAFLRVRRSARLASLSDSYGPSVAGSVDFDRSYRTVGEMNRIQLNREIEEELGILPDEIEIVPLGYGREILRGERPQLFSLAFTKLTDSEVTVRLNKLPEAQREFDEAVFVLLDEAGAALNIEAMMNLQLVREYLREYPLKQ